MSSFEDSKEALKAVVLQATQAAHALPAPSDIDFHRTLSTEFSEEVDAVSSKLLSLTSSLLHLVNDKVQELEEDDVLEEHSFEGKVVESVDGLLELVDGFLDEHKYGKKTAAVPVLPQTTQQPNTPTGGNNHSQSQTPVASSSKSKLDSNLVYAKHLQKPQLSFVPAQRPTNARGQLFTVAQFPETPAGTHPFENALQRIGDSLPTLLDQLSATTPVAPASFEETPFLLVDSVSTLEQLFKDLDGATEIAIDLEHHDFRSYAGLTCLMQLSLPGKDYIIDVLQPAVRSRLHRLNQWTTNPNIVKVLHGAKSDVQWLQRDFGIFLVGLFDTFFASKLLGYPYHGLANLLERFCNFGADKRFQLADWRIRPLPSDMLYYARADTHFLLFIFHSLLAAVKTSQPDSLQAFKTIAEQSSEVAARVYQHPVYDPDTGLGGYGWRGPVQKFNKHLTYFVPALPHEYTVPHKTSLEFHLFRSLHDWRDRVAREQDEAPRYILSNHLLFKLAEERPESMTKLRVLLGPQVKGKEELVGVIKKQIDIWENLTDQPLLQPLDQKDTGHSKTEDDIAVERPESLWTIDAKTPVAAASMTFNKADAGLSSNSSALFGPSMKNDVPNQNAAARYKKALQKVMATVKSAIPPAPSVQLPVTQNTDEDTKATFVPLEGRKSEHRPLGATQIRPESEQSAASSSRQAQEDADMSSDVIVVSEQSRKPGKQKKRPRSTTAEADPSQTTPASSTESNASRKKKARKEPKPQIAPHDYSKETSILDAKPTTSSSSKSKDKKKDKNDRKQKDNSSGKEPKPFKVPPRDRLNVASGGKSQTFK